MAVKDVKEVVMTINEVPQPNLLVMLTDQHPFTDITDHIEGVRSIRITDRDFLPLPFIFEQFQETYGISFLGVKLPQSFFDRLVARIPFMPKERICIKIDTQRGTVTITSKIREKHAKLLLLVELGNHNRQPRATLLG